MPRKRLRMFAGPNGSGKTGLIKNLSGKGIPLRPVVNADIITEQLSRTGFLDLSEFELDHITDKHWKQETEHNPEMNGRIKRFNLVPEVKIEKNILLSEYKTVDNYTGALIADFIRYMLVYQKQSFSFETVMSHPSKIDFLKFAASKGYITYLYFIATESPEINVNRVANRVRKGGHDVKSEKIISRYTKSLQLLAEALTVAERAFLIDNSGDANFVVLEKTYNNELIAEKNQVPAWVYEHVIEKLDG